jgi:hypothetical protein
MVEGFAGEGIDDRFVWVRVADPGVDHIDSRLTEQVSGFLGSLHRDRSRLASSPAGKMVDRGRRDQQHHLGPISHRQRPDSVDELARLRRLMGYREKTSHVVTSV